MRRVCGRQSGARSGWKSSLAGCGFFAPHLRAPKWRPLRLGIPLPPTRFRGVGCRRRKPAGAAPAAHPAPARAADFFAPHLRAPKWRPLRLGSRNQLDPRHLAREIRRWRPPRLEKSAGGWLCIQKSVIWRGSSAGERRPRALVAARRGCFANSSLNSVFSRFSSTSRAREMTLLGRPARRATWMP